LPEAIQLDPATRDALRELGIAVRDIEGGDVDDSCLPGSPRAAYVAGDEAILFDLGCILGPTALGGVLMSPERLDLAVVSTVLESYRELFGERMVDGEAQSGSSVIGRTLDLAADTYADTVPDAMDDELQLNLPGLAAWITSSDDPAAVAARGELRAIRSFTDELYELGLAAGEMRLVLDGLSARVPSNALNTADVIRLIGMVLDPSVALEAPAPASPAPVEAQTVDLGETIEVLLSKR
jgi:hypothetical protein